MKNCIPINIFKTLKKHAGVLELIAQEILEEKFGEKESGFTLFFTVIDKKGEDTTVHNIEFPEEVEVLDVFFQEFIEFQRKKNKS